ncbi:tetratricopeptide repeat protein [Persephonella sp.]|uniref:tetratricopeptide repeat protein n=1 Tax=Persephonella sp. TaxID=2060922 RepID=UPI0025ECCE56|nr:tetratricopeptide repeat protein [Persephonella sp.]
MRFFVVFFVAPFVFFFSCAEKEISDDKSLKKVIDEREWGRINRAKKAVKLYTQTADEYFKEGNYTGALEFYNKALVKLKYLKKLKHPRAAYIYEKMGDCYLRLGHKDTATEAYQKAYNIYLKFYGENNKKVKQVLEKIRKTGS